MYSLTRCVCQNTLNQNALKSANRIEAILVAFYAGGPKESSLARLAFTGVLKANSGVWSPPVAHKGELRTQSGIIGKRNRPSGALAANSLKYVRTTNGGVGERLKPAILKNKTGDSLSNTKFNEIYSYALGNQLEGDTLTVLAPVKAGPQVQATSLRSQKLRAAAGSQFLQLL